MGAFGKVFDTRLGQSVIMLLIGVLLVVAPVQKPLEQKTAGVIVIGISLLFIIYHLKILYYIKFYKSKEEFRSFEEKFIANYFEKKGIKAIYEKKLKLGKQELKPDFYLPEFEVYAEYWGRWNSDFEYRKECEHKRELYKENEIDLVELYPDNLRDKDERLSTSQLDWKFTQRLLNIIKKRRK